MGVGERGCRTWRARSRAGIAVLVLTSWFGALLAVSPGVSVSAAVTITSPTSFVAAAVHFVDTAGNVGPSTVGSYTLTSAVGRSRLDQPVPGGATGPTASGPDGATTPGPGITPAIRTPDGGAVVVDPSRTTGLAKLPEAIKKGAVDLVHGLPAIPGAVPGTDVPRAIKNVLGQTITKPQLPLALFVIVLLLFLLVQNQIDRRDPKLAAAPVTAEPELTFGPTLRPGGATA
jgi:hypothetical protein